MMCRQVLPDAEDAIEQIYIVKTEPGTEDDAPNMVPESVDHIKSEPMDEEDDDWNAGDYPAEQVEFGMVDVLIKEESRVESASETESDGDSKPVVKKKSKKKVEAKVGKTEVKKPSETKEREKQKSPTKKKVDARIGKEKKFSCTMCGKKTNTEYNLQVHLKTHEKKEKPKRETCCKYCGKKGLTNNRLKKHLEVHEKKMVKSKVRVGMLQRFVCHYCPSKFTTLFNLQRHEDQHNIPPEQQVHKRKEFFCYVCDHDYETKDAIQEHLYSHADLLPYTCEECETPPTIKSVRFLNQHLEFHKDTTNGSIKCPHCPLRFHSLKNCKLHEVIHVQEGSSALEALERRAMILSKKQNVKIIVLDGILRYACDLCDKSYALLASLRDHKNTHTESNIPKKLHCCQKCNKTFAFSGGLHAHLLTHSTELPYKCEYCEKAFKTTVQLIDHRRVHTGEKPFICGCGVGFRKRGTMASHRKICPEGNTAVKSSFCRICGNKSFPSYADLIAHVTEEHKEIIPRTKCQFCPAQSRNPLLLVRHEHLHQLPNVIKCDKCNRIFKNQALLEEHENTHMSEPQSFICDVCGMTFDQRRSFIRHKHRKTGRAIARHFNCDLCPKAFRGWGNFRRHQKLHYNVKSRYFIPSLVQEIAPPQEMEEVNLDLGLLVKTEME